MKADRLLSTLLLLQARGKMTGRELATKLEVSERTVHRDMDALSAAGVPVLALRGSRGGWMLDDEWRTQVPGLDESELRAFLMAQPRVIGDSRLAAAAERALEKVMAALPVSMRARAAFIRQRLYVDTTGWNGTSEDLSFLPIVQDAVSRDRKLAIHYRGPGKEQVERTIDPLGLVAKGSSWYLVAGTPAGFRTYRVSRIENASILDISSERPADFDLVSYWKTSTDRFRQSLPRFDTTLRAEPRAAEEMKRWKTVSPIADASDPEGWVMLRVSFEDEEQAAFVVRGYGPRVDVTEPEAFRNRIAAEAAVIYERLHPRPGPGL